VLSFVCSVQDFHNSVVSVPRCTSIAGCLLTGSAADLSVLEFDLIQHCIAGPQSKHSPSACCDVPGCMGQSMLLLESACITCVVIITKKLRCTTLHLNCALWVGYGWVMLGVHCRWRVGAEFDYPSVTASCAALSVDLTASRDRVMTCHQQGWGSPCS
jgi:hypothetical protein